MEYRVKMSIQDNECILSTVENVYNDEDCYDPEEIASLANRLLAGAGFPTDVANDIQSIGWERFAREKPSQPGIYLVVIPNGKFVKTFYDQWDGKEFVNFGDTVIFWAMFPSSPAFWSNGD